MKSYKTLKTLFKTPMVRAILRGEKDTTRRLSDVWAKRKPGDRLWVGETYYPGRLGYVYRADLPEAEEFYDGKSRANCLREKTELLEQEIEGFKWHPSIFMPRKACRITLEITEIFPSPLLNMREEEGKREGFNSRGDFLYEWDRINPKASWEANPLVWVVRFKRVGGGV